MRPYYDEDGIVIYHGDCREVLPGLAVDSVITDPPYGKGHYGSDNDVVTADLLRTLVGIGPCAVFGWPEMMVGWCVATGVVPDEWVTWWPTNGALRGTNMHGLWRESEVVAIFGAARWRDLRVLRTAASRRHIDVNYTIGPKARGDCHGDPETRHAGDVWTDAAPGLGFQSHLRLHPNEKPLGVLARLIEAVAVGTVLDPFMGSGTTLKAANDARYKAIGIEVSEAYCEIAAKRLAQGVLDFGAAS